ncbi:MAG: ABC transporter ATP-binding protein [Clostridia bacterium]|nr:ABC transporter ATP-binding protein [Clostridia bacterium]
MIKVKNLTKKYGDNTAVNDISFTIEEGRIYGLLGPNGAGKSTTMNIITGCLAATSGTVLVDGKDIFENPIEAKKHIGYLPEIPPLYTDMTPAEYLEFVAEAKGVPFAKRAKQVKSAMEKTDLIPVADRLIQNLSKGYRQRVGIAQAMIGDPDVIILDEPTVGLDPKQIIEIRELVRSLAKIKTVIISSHILSEIAEVCDHVLIISGGRLVADESLASLEERAKRSNGLCIKARCDADTLVKTVKSAGDFEVVHVGNAGHGLCEGVVSAESDTMVSEKVFAAFAAAGIPVSELYFRESSLENIFLKLTESSIYGDDDAVAASDNGPDGEDGEGGDAEDGDANDENGGPEKESDDDYKPLFGSVGEEDR